MNPREHRITEVLAYYIYLAEGRPEGRAAEHWLKAEQEIEAMGITDYKRRNVMERIFFSRFAQYSRWYQWDGGSACWRSQLN